MSKLYIYSHNPNSEGAKALKDHMGIKRIKNEKSLFKGKPDRLVINWGSSQVPVEVLKCRVLNHPDNLKKVTNKLTFFKTINDPLDNDFIPPWTEDFEEACSWVGLGSIVCARTILNGHSGAGIVLMEKDHPETLVKAPLYVKYVPKTEEYRVHVVKGTVIDVQRKTLTKAKAESGEEINWKIRNLNNGFIYQREGVNPDKNVLDLALRVFEIVKLDFGAADIVCHKKTGQPYILEINSAPGLTGTTVENYAKGFKEYQ